MRFPSFRHLRTAAAASFLAWQSVHATVIVKNYAWTGSNGWSVSGTFSYNQTAEDPASLGGGLVTFVELVSQHFSISPPAADAAKWNTFGQNSGVLNSFGYLPGSNAIASLGFSTPGSWSNNDPIDGWTDRGIVGFAQTPTTIRVTDNPPSISPLTWDSGGTATISAVPEVEKMCPIIATSLLGYVAFRQLRRGRP